MIIFVNQLKFFNFGLIVLQERYLGYVKKMLRLYLKNKSPQNTSNETDNLNHEKYNVLQPVAKLFVTVIFQSGFRNKNAGRMRMSVRFISTPTLSNIKLEFKHANTSE
jgi:hypothetical protein